MVTGYFFLHFHKKPFIFTPMFSNCTISLFFPYSGRLLAGLLLRHSLRVAR
jgi:hypothetical protein